MQSDIQCVLPTSYMTSGSFSFTKTAEPTISTDFIKSGSQFLTTTTAVAEMQSLSLLVNTLLEKIDLSQFEALKTLHTKICRRYPAVQAMSSIDPLLMEGREIMFNRKTLPHTDHLDPLCAWATMITFGNFTAALNASGFASFTFQVMLSSFVAESFHMR